MAFVLNASLATAWCFEDETTAFTEAVFEHLRVTEAVVPAIWPAEVANGVLVGERRQRVTRAHAERFLRILGAMPIRIDAAEVATVFGPVLALARNHNLSTYDASYLELAMREALPLATLDARLREAAARVGVPLVEDPPV